MTEEQILFLLGSCRRRLNVCNSALRDFKLDNLADELLDVDNDLDVIYSALKPKEDKDYD